MSSCSMYKRKVGLSYKKTKKTGGKKRRYKSKKMIKHTKYQKKKYTKNHKKNKSRKYKGGSSLGSSFVNGGLLSTGYTLGNVAPQNLALANPLPFNTYSKCS